MIEDILRSFSTYLSFPHNLKKEKITKKQKNLINKIYFLTKKESFSNKNKLKTHSNFSRNVNDLILKKKLKDFLKLSFIQKMFFVHNRIHIVLLLIKLLLCKNKIFWKRLMTENSVGGPIPFFCYRFSSGNRIRQVYHLKKFNDNTSVNLRKIKNVIEIGGGYGCMASIFSKINKNVNYFIFDTKEVCMLQYYYLNSLNIKTSLKSKYKGINLMYKVGDLKKISQKHLKDTLLISNWAISEMPISFRKLIIPMVSKCDYFLISYQSKFEKIDNNLYFHKFSSNLKSSLKTYFVEIKEMNFLKKNKHFYFFGKKKK